MPKHLLRIATRKSPLALWQANHVGTLLQSHWPDIRIELVPMLTSGDRFNKDKLQDIGGKGLFVKELEEALLDKRADFAVHSMKDVPAEFPEGLTLASVCQRDNPFDALVSVEYDNINALPTGAIIGTTSLRRQSQLLALRPDFIIKPLRGNINTRLDKLAKGEYDAIILATAGLQRMGMGEVIKEIITEETMLPACGQGALGIECRVDDSSVHQWLLPLNAPLSRTCVDVERRVNALLGGNCHVPLAVFCTLKETKQLWLRAKVLTLDGHTIVSDEQIGSLKEPMVLAENCVKNLLSQGAGQLLGLE